MVTDANMYWLPQILFTEKKIKNAFLRAVPTFYGTKISEYTEEDGNITMVIERPEGYASLDYSQKDYRLENQLNDMDHNHIDKGILKLPGCQEWLPLELCKIFNDEICKHVKNSKGRLQALAVVPPIADDDIFKELDRAIYDLNLVGIQLSAHYGNHYLDDKMFRPFFKKVNEMNIPIYVHHTPVPVEYKTIYEYNNLRRSLGRCIDQNIAIGREIFSGMFEEFPKLKLIHSMLGGGFHTHLSSLFPENSGDGRFDTKIEQYKKYFSENIYFELSHAQPWGEKQLACAIAVIGADKIIYGSSYPVKVEWFAKGKNFIETLTISEAEKEQILSRNAQKLYKF